MAFLAPLLLAALAAIAIPIVVHLVQRERRRVLEFPSLMFLRKIPYQSVRRRAIRHWPLLALRVLAFALIAFAFARPFLTGTEFRVNAAGGAREVVILLDRSYSMGYGNHWDRARAEARRIVGALGPDDRATLALFANEVEVAARSSSERGTLLSAIDRATIGSGATRYGPALRAAAGVLEASSLPRREVVLISDFQQTGWDRAQEQRLPSGVALTPISVAEEAANTAVVGMTFDRSDEVGRERIAVSAQLVNHGPKTVTARDVAIEVDGHRLETKRVSLEPHASAVVAFAPFIMGSGRARVSVRLAPDALAADDVFHAVVLGGAQVPVLIVEEANPAPDSSLYLVRALAVGSATRFQAHVTTVDQVSVGEIESAAVVVLNDTRPPSGAALRALDRVVRGGAGLLVVLGGQSTWPADAPDLLPGKLGASADRSGTRGGTLGYIDFAHPVFEIFSQPRSGDLTAPRVFRNRELVASGTVLARFDNGAAALVERRVDRGTVLAWTSTFDSYWNDLVLKPVFVPFVHQAMRHLARYVEPKASFTVGEALDSSILLAPRNAAAGSTPNAMVAVTPSGRRETLATGPAAAVFRFDEHGFYAIRPPAADAPEVAVAAVNVAPPESDLAAFDPAELVLAVTAGAAASAASNSRELLPAERERRQAIWWYLLAGGLILLVAEGIVASRLPRTA